MAEIEKKTCTKCKGEFPSTSEFFSKNKSTSDGLEHWCKTCKAAKQKDYRLEKTKERNQTAAARPERSLARKTRKNSIRNPAPIVKKPQTDQLTGASPAEIVIALRKGMAAEIVAMIQERFGL